MRGTILKKGLLQVLVLCSLGGTVQFPSLGAVKPAPELRQMVERDWALQEKRWGRTAESLPALREALARTDKLLEYSKDRLSVADMKDSRVELGKLQKAAEGWESFDAAARLNLYRQVRWLSRELALRNSLAPGKPLIFMKRSRFVCQMLHEYMAYFYDYGDVAGGGVFVLEEPGLSLKTQDVIHGRLPKGNFTTLSLSYDADTAYFGFAERAERKMDFYSPERRGFHLFSLDLDGGKLSQLTDGVNDDFDPCPLPDGGLAFMSSRRGGFARCNNPWEPTASYTLHRRDPDGRIRMLSAHETAEWHPFVMNDGRLVYIRWDYVDRSAANFHGLWTSHPDGTGLASLFGNYTMQVNACYQPHSIPGSDRLLFLAGAHHADVGGSLLILHSQRAQLELKTGEDRLDCIEKLTPEICFPEAAGWPRSYFHSPWPLSENCFLVSFSFEPLPGMSSGQSKDTRTGLYYFDRFGNLELLYRDESIASMYPIPLVPRQRPLVIAQTQDPDLGQEGEFLLSDVRRSFFAMPTNRNITELRIFQILPKTDTHIANNPRIGHANAEGARMLLGTVPLEEDGSAYFRAPAGKPIYFQAVDERGRAVQSMRSITYLQPGERRGCVGCHEAPGSAAANRPTLAMRRAASRSQPGPEGSEPLSFPLLVQPVLNQYCVRCHDGQEGSGKSKLALTGEPVEEFSRSYQSLKRYVRWYEWGEASISQIATYPGRIGADESPLTRILDDANHGDQIGLPDAARRKIYLWLDANVPFYGTYTAEAQLAQREGHAVRPPQLQ